MLATLPSPRRLVGTAFAVMAIFAIHPSFAAANAGDLDTGFGSGGVAFFAPEDIDAQDAPLRQVDGRIVGAGLLQNASDRMFLSRLNGDGSRDLAYGGGNIHTGIVSPYREGVSTLGPDGKITLVGGSSSGGKVNLERYNTNGSVDGTLGSNGRITYAVPGASAVTATHAVALTGGKTLVSISAVINSTSDFLLLRFTSTGIDKSFGSSGIAKVTFGTLLAPANASAEDFTVLSTGAIVLAGSVTTGSATTQNTALARVTANGAIDSNNFGSSGKVTFDASLDSTGDGAVAITSDLSGALTVTGSTRGDAFAARFTATGAVQTSFGTSGSAQGLGGAGTPLTPTDVTLDNSGRPLVTGRSTVLSGASRWTVARLDVTGPAPLDTAFGTGGRAYVPTCDSTLPIGPSGITVEPSHRILVLGSCGGSRQATVAAFLGTPALPGTTTLTVTSTAEAAGHERIRFNRIDPTAALGGSTLLQSAAVRGSAVRGSAVRGSAVRGSAVRGSAVRGSAVRGSALPLSGVPLTNGQTWQELLAGTVYADYPLQMVTIKDAYDLDPLPAGLAALTLADLGLEDTAVRGSSLAALLLNQVVLSKLPVPDGGWCAFLAGQPKDCPKGADPDVDTLWTLERAGDDFTTYYELPLDLTTPTDLGTGITQATVATIGMSWVDWSATPVGQIPAAQISSILSCGSACSGTLAERQNADPTGFSTSTVGDLVRLMPVAARTDITLGEIILGLVAPDEIPYENAPRASLLSQADIRSDDLQRYAIAFDVDCRQDATLTVTVGLPEDARVVPGSASRTIDGGAPANVADPTAGSGGAVTFALGDVCTSGVHRIALGFDVEPGSILGDKLAKATVSTAGESQSASAPVTVDDSRDASDTEPKQVSSDSIHTGHIAHAGDIDLYAIDAPAPGTKVSITMSTPADFDLTVFGVASGPISSAVRGSAVRGSAVRGSPVPDSSDGVDPEKVQTEQLQDITLAGLAVRGSAVRGSAVRGSSTNRGATDPESVTFIARPEDAGQQYIVQVSGYNGTTSATSYEWRNVNTPPAPPKPCITRSALRSGSPGAFPSLPLPTTTKTLILVDQQRMAALYPGASMATMRSKLDALATATDGAVIPVENHPSISTDAAFDAWDGAPCSIEAANAVVDRINAVVDDVRKGLTDLRSIVLVGPDDALPQSRIADYAVIENERNFAEDMVVDGKDTPISRAMRQSNLLSDNPYGDFDPQVWRGANLFVPDVALGRLIESPGEIGAQVDAYLHPTTGRELDPQTSFVTGYDFVSDGAQAVFGALQPASPGGISSEINETWTAAQAAAGINRPSAGFTSVNGHYDHYRAQPAAAGALLRTSDITPRAGSMAFTVGCHAGLNVEDVLASAITPAAAKNDWAQTFVNAGDLYAANTGYGYGDTEAVAYSEELYAQLARQLASGDVTAGQALMLAKQAYASGLGFGDDYDRKALEIATFYGIPMWKTKRGGGEARSVVPTPLPSSPNPTVRTDTFDMRPSFARVDTDRGSYWTADGNDPLVVQHRPIQPQTSKDGTAQDGLPVHGAIITTRESTDVHDVDPVFASPTADDESTAPEITADGTIFPAAIQTVTRAATADGIKDTLALVVGQFRAGAGETIGTQRLETHLAGTLYRSDSDDWVPPTIKQVTSFLVGGGVTFSVETEDTGAVGGAILYRTDADDVWRTINLAPATDHLIGGGTVLPAGATEVREWYAQIRDAAGNVSQTTNKGRYYRTQPVATDPNGPQFSFAAPPASGFYASSPTITIVPGSSSGATFSYTIDGGQRIPYTGPFTIPQPDEGDHVLQLFGSDGSTASARIPIDHIGPIGFGTATSSPNADGWFKNPVTVRFTCADDVAGVATCPPDTATSGEGAAKTVSGTATDRAGNSSTITAGPYKVDLTAPSISGAATTSPNANGWFKDDVVVHWTCSDALSGIKTCPTDSTITSEGASETASGTATDKAGNSKTATAGPYKIDRAAPNVVITTTGSIKVGGQLRGTATDALSGVDIVKVRYRSGGTVVEKTATMSCTDAATRKNCTWTASLPGFGFWEAVATGTDKAGRTGTSNTAFIQVTF